MKDSDPEKWVYREHTRVKHEILEKYLRGWVPILGSVHKRICYFDGFAGRGEYEGGFPGSPVIAMRVGNDLKSYIKEMVCVFIERDPDNFENLKAVTLSEESKCPHCKIQNIHGEFAGVITEIIKDVGAKLAPSFFFVDPFGFKGVPFNLIREILSIPRTEVFITFMYRDIGRFLSSDNVEEIFDELFGTTTWRQILERNGGGLEREHTLRDLYITQLREQAGVKFVFPFRVCMAEKSQTLYYLIHATNNFKGLFLMKGIMYNQGAEGNFAYLGPDDFVAKHQKILFAEDTPSFKKFLVQRFKGQTLSYDEIEEKSYLETRFIDKHYREALKELEKEGKIKINRISSKRSGLKGSDRITFL
jgi:three-Cys-motif partner protein